MYSTRVIERSISLFEEKTKQKLRRYTIPEVEERQKALEALKKAKKGIPPEFQKFIANERVLCQFDFHYWFERYHKSLKDGVVGGGLGRFEAWESQKILLNLIAKIQEDQYDRKARGETCDGILIADHKARQVGHTGIARALTMHQVTTRQHKRAMAASVDDGKIQELYEGRDAVIHESLPFYLQPKLEFDVKNEHRTFSTHSRITYMIGSQKSSLGQSQQFDIGHITECSEWVYAQSQIELDFFPTLPQSPNTLCVLESRANGRGSNWWFKFSEQVRKGRRHRWNYCFVPWYAEPKKYRRTPPVNWSPSEEAMLHAKLVYDTSAEFIGKSIYLDREQLYWWETTRSEYFHANTLHLFLTNYCATPEESFQHVEQSAFDPITLDTLRRSVGSVDARLAHGKPYEFVREASNESGAIYVPNCGSMVPVDREQIRDQDPRGIIWIYEHPKANANYYVGVDPTGGLPGWSRHLRLESDEDTDNGVVSVLRKGSPDCQVAEYAGPIDPEDLADIANALGRYFSGGDDDGQALMIVEVWPGPGGITQRKLINHYGYTHLWTPKYVNVMVQQKRNVVGWESNPKTRRDLWIRGKKHVYSRKVTINSPWLVEEMCDCRSDDYLMTDTAKAASGKHDDRVVAHLLTIYAANDWSDEEGVETKKETVTEGKGTSWQASDMSYDAMMDAWEDRFQELSDG